MLNAKQQELLTYLDQMINHAPQITRIAVFPDQYRLWQKILHHARLTHDSRINPDTSTYRQRLIVNFTK